MTPTDTLANTRLGPYLILAPIGRGGAATVYRARQEALGRDVAVKVLRRDADPQFAARFGREARAIAAMQHPNILPVYDFGEQGDVQYLVMRFVEGGRTLKEELAGGELPPVRALRLVSRLLDALGYAHRRGIVHRDIKPGNVLLPEPDWPLLADFGIAHTGESGQLTLAGHVIGTPDYMSPEQATGRPVDARSDLYSAGVVLFELLTGGLPFRGESALAVAAQQVSQPPPRPRLLNPSLPPEVEAPVLRALAKDPAERFPDAAAMAAELTRLADRLEALPPTAAPSPTVQPSVPRRRAGLPLILGALALLALLAWLALGRVAAPTAGEDPAAGAALPIRLEDTAWQGGFRRASGETVYGGRTATWIYGTATQYSAMRASFELPSIPACAAALRVEGMDSEGRAKTAIRVSLNGSEIYRGPNPLPDDDIPLETGTWAAHDFPLDTALLRPGRNELRIENLEVGAFSLPPFFMLDYAELRCRASR